MWRWKWESWRRSGRWWRLKCRWRGMGQRKRHVRKSHEGDRLSSSGRGAGGRTRIKRTRFIKGHIPRSSSDEQQGHSSGNPCAPYCTRGKHTQLTEQSASCAPEEDEEQSRHTRSTEGDCSEEGDQRDARRECNPVEQRRAVC